ncbi:50S ribosomal protein L25 [Candidatus Uhrbacteria bacterium]|nr:50S ribosomal protein L25 [Candidatus Uhrbacteria bacterium]
MADINLLEAQPRIATGRRVRGLRATGTIPAVVYGHGIPPQNVQVGKIPFEKIYRRAGESSLVDLALVGEKPVKVLIQDVQYDPLRGDVTHIDFRQVRMDEKLDAEVALRFIDESPAVKELSGILVKNITHLKVRCLPAALVSEIDVSLAPLKTFTDKIHVREIAVPSGMEVRTSADEIVALVEEPRSEEELKELEAPGAPEAGVEQVKVIADEKKAEREKEKVEKGEGEAKKE